MALRTVGLAGEDVAPVVLAAWVRALPIAFPFCLLGGAARGTRIMPSEDQLGMVDALSI